MSLLLLQCDKKEGGWDDEDDEDEYNTKNNYNQKDKYDFRNDDEDDKCTAEEREDCCTANEKKQVQVCASLGCNIRKVRMAELDSSPPIISTLFMKLTYCIFCP